MNNKKLEQTYIKQIIPQNTPIDTVKRFANIYESNVQFLYAI